MKEAVLGDQIPSLSRSPASLWGFFAGRDSRRWGGIDRLAEISCIREGLRALARLAEYRRDLDSEEQTDALGARLAAAIEPGVVIGLAGDLGAGKTRLTRATAIALGADPTEINSPTFVLIQAYRGRLPIYHFDAYRLRDADEFSDLGPEEYFQSESVCFIEWADRVSDALPEDMLRIEMTAIAPRRRRAVLTAEGPRALRVLERLIAAEDSADVEGKPA